MGLRFNVRLRTDKCKLSFVGGNIVSNCIVIKCGGSSIDELSAQFFHNIKALKKVGIQPIIVHGGAPALKEMLNKLKIEFEFIDELRKTTDEMMKIGEMVVQ